MATIANLQIDLSARTARFSEGLQRAQKRMADFQKRAMSLSETFQRLTVATQRAAIAYGALSGAIALLSRRAGQFASQIADAADQTGFAVETMQELRFAVEQSAGDFQSLMSALRAFNRRTAEAARGNQSFLAGFERLGFTQEEVRSGLQDMERFLLQVADRVAELGTTAEQSAILMTVMGDAGRRLVPFMAQGSAGIEALTQRARELGLVMDERQIRRLAAFNDRMGILGQRFAAAGREIGFLFLPAIETVAGLIEDAITVLQSMDPVLRAHIVRWTVVVGAVLGVVSVLGTLGRALSAAAGGLAMFGRMILLAFSPLSLKLALAGAAIYAFWQAWERDWGGIRSAAEKAWEMIDPIISAIGQGLETAWKWALDVAPDLWDWIKNTVEIIGDAVSTAWSWTTGTVSAFIGWIRDTAAPWFGSTLSTAWNWSTDRIDTFITWVRGTAAPWLGSTVSTAWDWTVSQVAAFLQWIRETAAPWFGGTVSTAWNWTVSQVAAFLQWVRETAVPWLGGTVSTAWNWTVGAVDAFLRWIRETAVPWFNSTVRTIWKWDIEAPDWWNTFVEWLTGRGRTTMLEAPAPAAEEFRIPVPDLPAISPDEMRQMMDEATGGAISAREAIRTLADEYRHLESVLPTESLEEFMTKLGTMESGLQDVENRLSSARGEFQLLEGTRRRIEEEIGEIDWSDSMQRTRAAFEWLRMGIENEFAAIARAAERLGITLEESLHLWWVMGGPALSRAQSLDVIATQGVTAREILRRRRLLGFQGGTPWTGWGPTDEVAGVVHRREAVIPWDVLRRGPGAVLEFLGAPGFQTGRVPTATLHVPDDFATQPGFLERVVESVIRGLEDRQLIDPQTAQSLRDLFGQMVDIISSLTQRAQDLWDRLGGFDDQLEEALEQARRFRDELEALGDVTNKIVAAAQARIDRLDDLVEIERVIAHATGQAFDETRFRAQELSRAISEVARAMFEAGRSMEEVAAVIGPWAAELEPMRRQIELQDAVTAGLERLASRLSDVDEGLASLVRNLRWEPGRGFSFDIGGIIRDAVAFAVDLFVDLIDTGRAEFERRLAQLPDPGRDVLGIAETFRRYENLGQNIRQRQQLLRDLQRQQQEIAKRTAVGAVGGGLLGFIFGGPIGAALGFLAGGAGSRAAAKKDLQPQIDATEAAIRELEQQIEGAVTDLINALGIAADHFASGIVSAFREADITGFSERLRESVRDTIRQAMIQAFVAQVLEPQITQLAEMVQDAFLRGAPLDMLAIDEQIQSIVDVSADLYDRFEELGLTVERTNQAMGEFVRNVPRLFKTALVRGQIASAVPLANGGIVTRPTLAMVGERGPEIVIPLDRSEGAGQTVVHVTINGDVYGVDDLDRRVRRSVGEALRQQSQVRWGV